MSTNIDFTTEQSVFNFKSMYKCISMLLISWISHVDNLNNLCVFRNKDMLCIILHCNGIIFWI